MSHNRGRRRIVKGVVRSNKMNKTIIVDVERLVKHPLYKKYIRRSTRLWAHDEKNRAQEGDVVSIMETRPLSKNKRWRLVEIVRPVAKGTTNDTDADEVGGGR